MKELTEIDTSQENQGTEGYILHFGHRSAIYSRQELVQKHTGNNMK